jgi:tetratricopeptide (TPR) repeat protein
MQDIAIRAMLKADSIQKNRYETHANLGTFYFHKSEFASGIDEITKAIEINPNAHFGREVYQKRLAEYVLTKLSNGKIAFPLEDAQMDKGPMYIPRDNFYIFLLKNYNRENSAEEYNLPSAELEKAIKGIQGMLKFGNHDSPVLMEALGDLLMLDGKKKGARQLAARAYLRAGLSFKDRVILEQYKMKAHACLFFQVDKETGIEITVPNTLITLRLELTEAEEFYEQIRNDEINWIFSGSDPEAGFATKYYEEPQSEERKQIIGPKAGRASPKDIRVRYIAVEQPYSELALSEEFTQFVDSFTGAEDYLQLAAAAEDQLPKTRSRLILFMVITTLVVALLTFQHMGRSRKQLES